jgi:hypothetical protein
MSIAPKPHDVSISMAVLIGMWVEGPLYGQYCIASTLIARLIHGDCRFEVRFFDMIIPQKLNICSSVLRCIRAAPSYSQKITRICVNSLYSINIALSSCKYSR